MSGKSRKDLTMILIEIGAMVFAIFVIFRSLPATTLDVPTAATIFIIVSLLVISIYMLGFIAFAFIVIPILSRLWVRSDKKEAK